MERVAYGRTNCSDFNARSSSACSKSPDDSQSNCQLSLEVEIAKSLERMLKSPNKFDSALLDVKILRNQPNEQNAPKVVLEKVERRRAALEQCKTKLRGESGGRRQKRRQHGDICANSAPVGSSKHPRDFTGAVSRSVEAISDSCQEDDAGRQATDRVGDYRSRRKGPKTETSSGEFSVYTSAGAEDTSRQVYAAPRVPRIRKMLKCQDPDRHGRDPKAPCLCERCGMVDVILEGQKRPIFEEASTSPESDRKKSTTRVPTRDHNDRCLRAVNELCQQVKRLEWKLREHEECYVTKEYLKIVVDKLLGYVGPKVNPPTRTHRFNNAPLTRNIATQCSRTIVRRDVGTVKVHATRNHRNTVYGYPVLAQPAPADRRPFDKETVVSPDSARTKDASARRSDVFWRWGEEIIKPGFDLKSKIATLIQETFGCSKSYNQVDTTCQRSVTKKPHDNVECDSEKTLYLGGSEPGTIDESNLTETKVVSGGNFRKILDAMSEKLYADYVNQQNNAQTVREIKPQTYPRDAKRAVNDDLFKQNIENCRMRAETEKTLHENAVPTKKSSRKCLRASMIPKFKKNEQSAVRKDQPEDKGKLHVAYVNPNAATWKDDSCMCFRIEEHFKRFLKGGCKGSISHEGKWSRVRKEPG